MNETPDQHDPDWPRYPETVLTFATRPPLEIDLREIPSDSALAQLREAGLGKPFAIVTAFDPEGKKSPRSGERAAETGARSKIDVHGIPLRARGLLFPRPLSLRVQRRRQHAATDGARSRARDATSRDLLVRRKAFLDSGRAIVETDPLMLPRSS